MATVAVTKAASVKNPGRLYRAMYCSRCGRINFHRIDFIAAESTEHGRFVWLERRCTGIEPLDDVHPHRLLRLVRECGFTEVEDLPLSQWEKLVEGTYY